MQVVGVLVFLVIAASQIILGVLGLHYLAGLIGPIVAFALLGLLRVTFPFTIGVFFAGTEVLGWPWYIAALVAAPGLLVAIPSLLISTLQWVMGRQRA